MSRKEPSPYIKPTYTKRTCLKCNNKFNSTGPGNRICPRCNSKNPTGMNTTKVAASNHPKPLSE